MYYNIVNAIWLTGEYVFPGAAKPTLAWQFGNESQVLDVQGAITPWNNITFTVEYDDLPRKTDTVVLPPGVTCPAGATTIGGTAAFPYFLPSVGTPQCHDNGDGTIAYLARDEP